MATRLLFQCGQLTRSLTTKYDAKTSTYVPTQIGGARLHAITPHSDPSLTEEQKQEIESFFQATPSGSLEFQSINEGALAQFEPGKRYYITIEPAD